MLTTNQIELLNKVKPQLMFMDMDKVEQIEEILDLNKISNIEELRSIRNDFVKKFSALEDKAIEKDDTKLFRDTMTRISMVTAVIDRRMFNLGGKV